MHPEERIREIISLSTSEVRANLSALTLYRREAVVGELNALSNRLLEFTEDLHSRVNGVDEEINEEIENNKIPYDTNFFSIIPNTVRINNANHEQAVKRYIEDLCHVRDITIEQLMRKRRGYSKAINLVIKNARMEAVYTVRKRFELSYPAIAKILERDHSTIIGIYKKAEEIIEKKS